FAITFALSSAVGEGKGELRGSSGRDIMCCQVRVRPVNRAIAAEVLEVGQFSPEPKEPEWPWVRAIPEEGTMVLARIDSGSLMLTLRPGVHTHADHATRRLAASVMFEIAW